MNGLMCEECDPYCEGARPFLTASTASDVVPWSIQHDYNGYDRSSLHIREATKEGYGLLDS